PKDWTCCLAFSPDGKTLACGNAERKADRSEVRLWDVATRQTRQRLTIGVCKDESYIYYVTFSPDGKTAVGIENHSAIHLWDVASGTATATFSWDTDHPDTLSHRLPAIYERHTEPAEWFSLCFTPNHKLVALGEGPDHTVNWCEVANIPLAKK